VKEKTNKNLIGVELGNTQRKSGFTIIELIVTVAIFTILLSAMLGTFSVLARTVKVAREKTVLASLASNYLEIVKNMPYSDVGTLSGNPNGSLVDFTNAISQKIEAVTYKIYYEVTYMDDPSDGTVLAGTDSLAADYKQVKMNILNTVTGQLNSFFTTIVPQGLEGTTNAGALLIQVLDSQGNPLAGADIHITYPTTTPTIVLDRQTNASGQWVEVGLPIAANKYRVVVSKTGYSSDQTYHATVLNPNPVHPDATIANGTVTQMTLSIDTLANLNIKTLNSICQPVNNVNVNVRGGKLIGTSPSVYKYNNNYGSTAGGINLTSIEWDTYTPTLLTGQSWIIRGTSPIQKIDVAAGTTQTYTMILDTNTTSTSLLVVVKDSSSQTALENVSVDLKQGSTTLQTYVTGGSVWPQNSWTGGAGLTDWSTTTPTRYFQDSGTIDTTTIPTGVRLKKTGTIYDSSGWLESATFDTGTNATNYTILSWLPASQSASTTIQFQIAVNNDNASWNYVGPDGTAATYFTTPGTDMGSSLDGNRYIRYKTFLSTAINTITPVLTSVNVNFVTGCFTPGQVIFTGLSAGAYNLTVSLPGYQTQNISLPSVNGNQLFEVLMSP